VVCLALTQPALAATRSGAVARPGAAARSGAAARPGAPGVRPAGLAAAAGRRRTLLVTIRYRAVQQAARADAGRSRGVTGYLDRTSRAYTARKNALLRRHPGVRVLARYRMLPELLVQVRGTAAARSLGADHGVLSVEPVAAHRLAACSVTGRSAAVGHAPAPRLALERAAASQHAARDPAGSQAAAGQPGASDPAASEPAAGQPAAGDPGASDPAASQPAGAGQAAPAGSPADLDLINDLTAQASGDRGAGTAVAVLDDGTNYHKAAFGSCPRPGAPGCRVLAYRDFAAPPRVGLSFTGHGTNVAGQVLKVAPDTALLVGNVFHKTAAGPVVTNADLMSGLNWVVTQAARRSPAYSVRAVNMSLGDPFTYHQAWCGGSPFAGAFSQLLAVGIQPVVAAGNDAYQGTTFRAGISAPACAPGTVAVGAVFDSSYGRVTVNQPGSRCTNPVTYADEITCFSQGGPLVSLLAPGWDEDAAGVTKSGTSQATPLVTGAIAALASGAMSRPTSQIVTAMRLAGHPVQDPRTGLLVPRLDVWAAEQRLASG
jgi:hypothetical protein